VRKGELGITRDGFLELLLRLGIVVEVKIGLAQQEVELGLVAPCSHQLRERLSRLVATLQLAIGYAEHAKVIEIVLFVIADGFEGRHCGAVLPETKWDKPSK
jgi:hypothetical protein